jgi:hypothetical protein
VELRDDASIKAYGHRTSTVRDLEVRDVEIAENFAKRYLEKSAVPEIRGVLVGRWNHGYMPNMTVRFTDAVRKINQDVLINFIKISYPSHVTEYHFGEWRGTFQEWMERIDLSRSIADYSFDSYTHKQGNTPVLNVKVEVTGLKLYKIITATGAFTDMILEV